MTFIIKEDLLEELLEIPGVGRNSIAIDKIKRFKGFNPKSLSGDDFADSAKTGVAYQFNAFNLRLNPMEKELVLNQSDLYIVWQTKVLQNNKCLISTDVVNGYYWEVTYNGDKREMYVDMYHKKQNIKIDC